MIQYVLSYLILIYIIFLSIKYFCKVIDSRDIREISNCYGQTRTIIQGGSNYNYSFVKNLLADISPTGGSFA